MPCSLPVELCTADAHARRIEALRALDFPDFDAALALFNYGGQRRHGGRTIQDYFFVPRRQSAAGRDAAAERVCTRCWAALPRHGSFFLDAAKGWVEADQLCRPCLVCAMRKALGEWDEGAAAKARRVVQQAWAPNINTQLAGEVAAGWMVAATQLLRAAAAAAAAAGGLQPHPAC